MVENENFTKTFKKMGGGHLLPPALMSGRPCTRYICTRVHVQRMLCYAICGTAICGNV